MLGLRGVHGLLRSASTRASARSVIAAEGDFGDLRLIWRDGLAGSACDARPGLSGVCALCFRVAAGYRAPSRQAAFAVG
jgi:hypothetical protein